jgi:hypothetical protein
MCRLKNLIGMKFNRWTVIERAENTKLGQAQWKCICECGNTSIVAGRDLRQNKSRSCGCLQRETATIVKRTHGKSNTRLHRIWSAMRARCYNLNSHEYDRYGGRGIEVCEEWRSNFESFYEWAIKNGYADSLSIDRINNDGNYEPSNCRWATNKVQASNRRTIRLIEYKGEKKILMDWAETLKINYHTLASRLHSGKWTIEEAFSTPKLSSGKPHRSYNTKEVIVV